MQTIQELKLGVYGIVQDGDRVLVIKKSRGPYKGKFDLPGGGVEHGESIEEGLRREFREEAGLEVNVSVFLGVNEAYNKWVESDNLRYDSHHVGIYYLVDVTSGILKEDSDGLDSLGALYVPISDLNESNTSKIALPMIRKAAKVRNV